MRMLDEEEQQWKEAGAMKNKRAETTTKTMPANEAEFVNLQTRSDILRSFLLPSFKLLLNLDLGRPLRMNPMRKVISKI